MLYLLHVLWINIQNLTLENWYKNHSKLLVEVISRHTHVEGVHDRLRHAMVRQDQSAVRHLASQPDARQLDRLSARYPHLATADPRPARRIYTARTPSYRSCSAANSVFW